MKNVSKNNYNIIMNGITSSMTEDEYAKAKEFYKFLMTITKCSNGILTIERKKLIDIVAAYMECTPVEAYTIMKKMYNYGWIKAMDKDYIVVNLEKKI
jgi:hypothetical protein